MSSVQIEKVDTFESLYHFLDDGSVVSLYKVCFGEPPYEEICCEEEIRSLFLEYFKKGILIFCYEQENNKVIGFAASVPLKYEIEVSMLAKDYGYDPLRDWYHADLGIAKAFRRKGIGAKLVEYLIHYTPSNRIIMRTQENNMASQTCHIKLGFKVIDGMYQYISKTRTSGDMKTDKRIFLSYEKEKKVD